MDGEIDAFLQAERFGRAAPHAATAVQAAWRARAPRLKLAAWRRCGVQLRAMKQQARAGRRRGWGERRAWHVGGACGWCGERV